MSCESVIGQIPVRPLFRHSGRLSQWRKQTSVKPPPRLGSARPAIARTNSATPFRDSLPIAGRDGTLVGRLLREAGRVFAKTGTLTYDHSLSGYAVTPTNEILAFSIFCNDASGRSNPVRIIDQIAGLIAEAGSAPSAK